MKENRNTLLLEATGITRSYGDRVLLDIDRLTLYDGDRIGLVGENGAGKSTLLAILSGQIKPDSGTVFRSCEPAVIRQSGPGSQDIPADLSALFSARVPGNRPSGGEKTRQRIAGALGQKTPLLFADEPTTDLDEEGIRLLSRHLMQHEGALLLVSHDRALLNLICKKIWYLRDGKITVFPGGYDDFTAWQKQEQERAETEYEQYRKEKARLEEAARHMQEMARQVKKAPSRMGNSEARLHKREATDAILQLSHQKRTIQNRAEHLEKKERPKAFPNIRMSLGAAIPIRARYAVTAENLSVSAGEKQLLRSTSFSLPSGTRTVLTGKNGCGKTTLLRLICSPDKCGNEVHFTGRLRLNDSALIGWFDQDHESTLDPDKTALENALISSALPESTVRITFARMNLRGDQVFKPVSVLSGGEKAKAALVKLLVSECNVLILDEPTNHLDVFTLEALESLLSEYEGTLLFSSHDRAFQQAVATRQLRIENQQILTLEEPPRAEDPLSPHEKKREQDRKNAQLQLTSLEMRLSQLIARLSSPRKGDRPDLINEQILLLQEEIKEFRKQNDL